jgi:hypothetical protein
MDNLRYYLQRQKGKEEKMKQLLTTKQYQAKTRNSRIDLRTELINAAQKAGAAHPISAAQMACIQLGLSQSLTAALFCVARRTIYDNCTSGRYNYPEASARTCEIVKAALISNGICEE